MPEEITDPLKRRIAQLARETRGARPRDEIYGQPGGPSRSAYINFESSTSWPQAATLRKIEKVLGWRDQAITEVLSAVIDPEDVSLALLKQRAEDPVFRKVSRKPGLVQKVSVVSESELGEFVDEFSLAVTKRKGKRKKVNSVHPALAAFSDYELAKELSLRMAARDLG